ncbi:MULTISPECIES: hypothetical protein [unclassified Paenibacillus]|uniref:hypothetical protein n=1 Tax=unclassified Paenibacillus TaxID=185978 RepID=UPI0036264F75
MVLYQIAIGVIVALLLWGFIKLTFHSMLWIIGIAIIASLIVPGAFLFLSGLLFILIGMLATLGIMFILGAFRP